MLPAQQASTDVQDTQESGLRDLNTRWERVSSKIAKMETRYQDMGLIYHKTPIPVREHNFSDADQARLKDAFIVHVDRDNVTEVPDQILFLKQLRHDREQAKLAIRRGDREAAIRSIESGNQGADSFEYGLDILGDIMEPINRYWKPDWADMYMITHSPSLRPETREEVRLKSDAFRDFALNLPESCRAIELGLASRREIISDIQYHDEDRVKWDQK